MTVMVQNSLWVLRQVNDQPWMDWNIKDALSTSNVDRKERKYINNYTIEALSVVFTLIGFSESFNMFFWTIS